MHSIHSLKDDVTRIVNTGGRILKNVGTLSRLHFELLSEETKEQKRIALSAGIWSLATGIGAFFSALFLSIISVLALMAWGELSALLATTIVGALWVAITIVAGALAKQQLQQITFVPTETLSSAEENLKWLIKVN